MSELSKKVEGAVKRLRTFEPPDGYYLAFSGGKDSVVVKALCDLAGVKYDGHHHLTTVDPPELVRFVRDRHPDISIEKSFYPDDYRNERLAGKQITMWNLIPEKLMPPTRLVRYCCEKLKEHGGEGRVTVTGVRWAESNNRSDNQGPVVINGIYTGAELEGQESLFDDDPTIQKAKRFDSAILMADNDENRKLVEFCYQHHKTTVNPIVEWKDADVWDFIKAERVPYCELYDCGYARLGCIGCPMAGPKRRREEFNDYPKFLYHYMHTFERMLEKRREADERDRRGVWRDVNGKQIDNPTAQDVLDWWLSK